MSGLRRAIRHPDRTRDPHARARGLLSDRLTEVLAPVDGAWLEAHLDGCVSCRRTASEWTADRELLRQLRTSAPPAPRDLGARLGAALDAEEAKAPRRIRSISRRATRPPAGLRSRTPALALAGVAVAAVVALVVLPVVLPFGGPGESAGPLATPVTVTADPVAFAHRAADGTYVISAAAVDRVCPGNDASACGTLGDSTRTIVTLDVRPTTILLPAGGSQGVVVSATSVYAISFPKSPDRVTPPPPSPSTPVNSANPTPAATGVPASPPVGTPVPSGSPAPASAPPASSAPPETPLPSVASLPPGTPAPIVATTLAILDDVVLVGGAPSYSPDGKWVAFSARPADGSDGPDVYVWQAGEKRARALTDDHASIFSAWLGDRILASTAVEELPVPSESPAATATPPATSRPHPSGKPGSPPTATPEPIPTPEPTETPAPTPEATPAAEASASPAPAGSGVATPGPDAAPTPGSTPAGSREPSAAPTPEPTERSRIVGRSFLLDPATGEREAIARAGIWRPVVDPSGQTVVFWTGSFAWSESDAMFAPVRGRLVTASWADLLDPAATLDTTALPGGLGRTNDVTTWDVGWDVSGEHMAAWVGDAAGDGKSVAGRLSLFAVDASGGPTETLLDDAAAMPGFSLGRDRLAWSTPPGRNGQGSLVGVLAWTGSAPGAVYSAPEAGSDPVVVAR